MRKLKKPDAQKIKLGVISGAKDEGYNLKYNNKRIDSKWNQLS